MQVQSLVGTGDPFQYSCLENYMDRGAQLPGVLAVALRLKGVTLGSLCSIPITGQCRTTKDQLSYFNPGQL